jgi:hypothetical protein
MFAAPQGGPILSNAATTQGAPPDTFTNNGALAQTGTLSLTPGANDGAHVVNHGQWTATGQSTIFSTNCCIESTGIFENDGTVTVAGELDFVTARFQAQPGSTVNGLGTVKMIGGVPELIGPWNLGGGTTFQLTNGAKTTITGATTIGGKLLQEGTSQISGTGTFGGSGIYTWLGGLILANLTLADTLTTRILSPDPHELSNSTGSGVLTSEGGVQQGNFTTLLLNGTIVNKGTWRVLQKATATIQGGTCCVTLKKFRNAGTLDVEGNLTLGFIQYTNPPNDGVITGGGIVRIKNGIHQLNDGGAISGEGTNVIVTDNAQVHGTGTLKVDASLVIDDSTLLGTFTIGGTGQLTMFGGTIDANLTTGPDLSVRLLAGATPLILDHTTGTGLLSTKGHVLERSSITFQLVGPAHIVNSGKWEMQRAALAGSVCCSNPAMFVNEERWS